MSDNPDRRIDTMQPGHFCWMELMTPDRPKAKQFYEKLLGWQSVDREMRGMTEGSTMTYTMSGPAGKPYQVAGMMDMEGPMWEGIPPHWMAYISVKDVDASAAKVKELGGTVKVPPMDIPSVGRFCIIQDPTGAVVSLITLTER